MINADTTSYNININFANKKSFLYYFIGYVVIGFIW